MITHQDLSVTSIPGYRNILRCNKCGETIGEFFIPMSHRFYAPDEKTPTDEQIELLSKDHKCEMDYI